MRSPHIAVIGAGISGLGAARSLVQDGFSVTVFEKSRALGGRVASRRFEGAVFDHGAQNIKSQGTSLDTVARELGDDAVFFDAPICLYDDAILPPDQDANAAPKWTCRGGMTRLAKHLAAGLDIRFETRVARLEEGASGLALFDESDASLGEFDSVIATIPAPQAVMLLEASTMREDMTGRLNLLRSVEYSRCLSILLHHEAILEADWYALLARDRSHPLLWLARENAKGFAGHGTALVAQLGHEKSVELWDASDPNIISQTCGWINEVVALPAPLRAEVKRWRYSQPRNSVAFEEVNPHDSCLIFCGDATSAARVPAAYESGLQAAQRINEKYAASRNGPEF